MPVLEAPVREKTIDSQEQSVAWSAMSLEEQVRAISDPELDIEEKARLLSQLDLPSEDGIPMETNWHRIAMNLLIDSVHALWRGRTDYFAGGNMFIYFSLGQLLRKHYRGPDFFVVKGVDGTHDRKSWIVWKEDGRYPDVIIELASPSTVHTDLTVKKDLYEETFHTSEYFCYDPDHQKLLGWQLRQHGYLPLEANEHGWLWSEELHVWIGRWEGEFQRVTAVWPRFYTGENELVLTFAEAEAQRAEAEAQRANEAEQQAAKERQRADMAQQQVEVERQRADRLAAKLQEIGIEPDSV